MLLYQKQLYNKHNTPYYKCIISIKIFMFELFLSFNKTLYLFEYFWIILFELFFYYYYYIFIFRFILWYKLERKKNLSNQ